MFVLFIVLFTNANCSTYQLYKICVCFGYESLDLRIVVYRVCEFIIMIELYEICVTIICIEMLFIILSYTLIAIAHINSTCMWLMFTNMYVVRTSFVSYFMLLCCLLMCVVIYVNKYIDS